MTRRGRDRVPRRDGRDGGRPPADRRGDDAPARPDRHSSTTQVQVRTGTRDLGIRSRRLAGVDGGAPRRAFDLTRRVVGKMIERAGGESSWSARPRALPGVAPGRTAYALRWARSARPHPRPGARGRAVRRHVQRRSPRLVRTRTSEPGCRAGRHGLESRSTTRRPGARYRAGRIVEVDEVAQVIAFLAGEEASGVNGEGVVWPWRVRLARHFVAVSQSPKSLSRHEWWPVAEEHRRLRVRDQ